MIVIDLSEYPNNTSICTLCRELIRQGARPDEVVRFTRGTTQVFTQDFPLRHWAKLRVVESTGNQFPRFIGGKRDDLSHHPIAA